MALKSLNQLRAFRNALIGWRNRRLARKLGIVFGEGVSISLSSRFVSYRAGDISVGDRTLIAFKTLLISRDNLTGEDRPIRIGRHCFIGGGSVILPGVTVGDECIVGGGAVVFEDVPPRSIVVGNPAVVLKRDIVVGPMGRLEGADENSRRLYKL